MRRPQLWMALTMLCGVGAILAVVAATSVPLPTVSCSVPTAASQRIWHTAASHVDSDVSTAKYLALAGGLIAVGGIAFGRPRIWSFYLLVPFAVAMLILILYADGITNRSCGI